MCGHVGVMGEITHKEETAFKQLLIVDQLRGAHSTGVLSVGKHTGNITIAKQVGDPNELMNDKRFDDLMTGHHRVLLGHNRYATQGKVNRHNAHPFEFDNIVGAHNGTLNQRYQLKNNNKFDVDSMAFFSHLNEFGVEDAVSKIQGAWAFLWWDKVEKRMNFLRNAERDLWITYANGGKQLFWASEGWMLSGILGRNGIEHERPVSLLPDRWISFALPDGGVIDKDNVSIKKVEAKKQPPVQSYQGSGSTLSSIGPRNNLNAISQSVKNQADKKLTLVADMPTGVLGNKNVLFEVGMHKIDDRGGKYFELENPLEPNIIFRMYVNQKEYSRFAPGDMIQGDVAGWVAEFGGYFKINAGLASIIVDENSYSFKNHRGIMLTKKQFEDQYKYCTYCNSDIRAEEDNKLFSNGDCLCPECVKNPELKDYLTHA